MYLHLRPWWTPVDPANPEQEITVNFDTTTVFAISAFQYISIATVFSSGPPFRAPLYKNRLYSLALLLLSVSTVLLLLNIIPAFSTFFSLLLPFPSEPGVLPFQWMLLVFIVVSCELHITSYRFTVLKVPFSISSSGELFGKLGCGSRCDQRPMGEEGFPPDHHEKGAKVFLY